jgi:integrase
MNAYPFSIFKRADRNCFSVAFKDENGKYLRPVSTGKKTEEEATQAAFLMLRDGIPQNKNTITVQDLSFKDMVRKIKTGTEAETILAELRRQGWLKGYAVQGTHAALDFIGFMTTFWDWVNSPYIQEKLRKNHGIHRRHCKLQGQAIALHWSPFFKGRVLGEIVAQDIDGFINHMAKKELSPERKNVIIKAGTKPLRWAFSKGMIQTDPTQGHILFSGDEQKREILRPAIAAALFRAEWKNKRAKLANMVAAVTGMRSGEILALRLKHLGTDCLYVEGSWNKEDKDKTTKNNETRTVEFPFPFLINELVEQAKQNPWGVSPDSYIFWTDYNATRPMLQQSLIDALRKTLIQIGLTKDEAEQYLFHSWRHFYTAYMIRKLGKKLLKSQTGHKTDKMVNHYGDHEIDGDREIIQKMQVEAFGAILPQQSLFLDYKGDEELAIAI